MTNNEIALALSRATEIEKAELAQHLLDALAPLGGDELNWEDGK